MRKQKVQVSEEYHAGPLDPAKVWTTFDIGLGAALIVAGFTLLSLDKKSQRNKALLVFKKEDGLEEIVDLYWSDRFEGKLRKYFDTLRMLKNRLYSENL